MRKVLSAALLGLGLITVPASSYTERQSTNVHMWQDVLRHIDSDDFEFAVTPVGRGRVLFTRRDDNGIIIMETVWQETHWSEPEPASFAVAGDADPFFDPYLQTLYFMSRAPHAGKAPGADDYDIWQVSLEGNSWGTPTPLGPGVNTPAQEIYPTTDKDGLLYFASNREGGLGGNDIYIATPVGADDWQTENAGPVINSEESDSNPLILPDGRTLIFYSARMGGYGEVDLYRADGGPAGWTPPINLGPRVNSPVGDYAPSILDAATFVYSQGEHLRSLPMSALLR